MFIFTNTSSTLPSPTPPTLSLSLSHSLSIIHYLMLSLSSGHCERKMWDCRTDRCCRQLLLPKVQLSSGIFPQTYKVGSWRWPSPELLNQPPLWAHINTGDQECHTDHTCHGDWTHTHSNNLLRSSHLQWLRLQHVKGQTGDLRSIYKSMAAGARHTETDERGGEWRPVPLVIPGETWARTLPGCIDLFWTDSGHYYAVYWGIYMADWQAQDNGYNCFFIFSDVTNIFSQETKRKKQGFGSYYERYIPALCWGTGLYFFFFLVGCVTPAWEYHEIINRRWLRHLFPVPLIHQCSHQHQNKRTRDLRKSLQRTFAYFFWHPLGAGGWFLSFLPVEVGKKKLVAHWQSFARRTGAFLAVSISGRTKQREEKPRLGALLEWKHFSTDYVWKWCLSLWI